MGMKPLPEIRPVPEVNTLIIEPLKKTKKARQNKAKPKTVTPATQPSYSPTARMDQVPPPVEKKVTVLFESIPKNAELLLNGLYVGSAPIQLPVRSGVHNVRMMLAGHDTWERQVKVYQGLRVLAVFEKSSENSPVSPTAQ